MKQAVVDNFPHSQRRAPSKSPVVKAYSSSHGTPVISIHLQGTPRQRYNNFEPLISPTYSEPSDDETPAPTPVKDAPPLYVVQQTYEPPLVPFSTPKLMTHTRRKSSAVHIRKPSLGPLPPKFETLSQFLIDIRHVVSSHLTRNRPVRRLMIWTLLVSSVLLVILALSYLVSATTSQVPALHVQARARTLLHREAGRHADIGADQPNLHFAGRDAHAGRLQHDEEPLMHRDQERLRDEERVAGIIRPGLIPSRRISDEARGRSAKLPLGQRLGDRILAGGLAYPGLVQARKQAAEAYQSAIVRPGISEKARAEAQRVIYQATDKSLPMLPIHAQSNENFVPGSKDEQLASVYEKAVHQVYKGEKVEDPRLAPHDLKDTPELESKAQEAEEAAARKPRKNLPLRLARFKDERFVDRM